MYYLNSDNYYRDDLDNRQVMVTIRCIAYNQEKYIREALEGFIMQKANFRFEAIVHDDASTDGTADIIREYAEKYPSIIKPIFETENQYSKRDGSLNRLMHQHVRGKYIAFCEGDDYWTDPLKLQKQVDFLEQNEDYSLVCCNVDLLFQNKSRLQKTVHKMSGTFGIDYLIMTNTIATCSTLICKTFFDQYNLDFSAKNKRLTFGDYQIWLYMATKGKCMILEETMCVYRICDSGVSNIKGIPWMHSRLYVLDYFATNYHIDNEAKFRAYFNFFRIWASYAALEKDALVYNRAMDFYSKNGFFWTNLLLKFTWNIGRPRKLCKFLNSHNRIRPIITKSYLS